ncbi:MAG: hypothetical protein HGB32_06365 [Geobacteraceae bacterium]|nr:hypothetical protein [Geobacteraceae bacterium]NTW79757.1 hypothetical protein [Geobacteraceae bacterium]
MPSQKFQAMPDLTESQLAKVRSLRIYFGHQSVGRNILDGLQTLAGENPAYKLNVVQTDTPETVSGPVLAHFKVGANENPISKIASFKEHVLKSGNVVDVVFFKFCYVDFGANTDGEALFQAYKLAVAEIRKAFPKLVIVHATLPLTTIDSGVKWVAKKVLGKSAGEEANQNRTRYNDMVRKEFVGKEPLFDLAAMESTAPDGSRCEGSLKGVRYEALCSDYTEDGGHLNKYAARRGAIALVYALAQVADLIPTR